VLEAALQAGAVLAEPGEFTRRAFMNGRLDLAQAEAVADLVAAQSAAETTLAARQLAGKLSTRVNKLSQKIFSALVALTAELDFNEEGTGVDLTDLSRRITEEIQPPLADLLAASLTGHPFRYGLRLALVGAPNVGKSSLFNALAGQNRALVSSLAGTTRDYLTIDTIWEGLRIELCDTAGLSIAPTDELDVLGQQLTRERLQAANLILWVREAGSESSLDFEALNLAQLPPERTLIVWNKLDLAAPPAGRPSNRPEVAVSATTGLNLPELKTTILKLATGQIIPDPPEVVPSLRHRAALTQTDTYIKATLAAITTGQPPDICALELRSALDALGLICGRTTADDLLNEIFSRFCLGK
jgi:tRNA modification GTPase